jgi:hypothetical protein
MSMTKCDLEHRVSELLTAETQHVNRIFELEQEVRKLWDVLSDVANVLEMLEVEELHYAEGAISKGDMLRAQRVLDRVKVLHDAKVKQLAK